jgi:hypothetical protein
MPIFNFSWVIPGKLAGSAMPGGPPGAASGSIVHDLSALRKEGILMLVSLHHMPPIIGEQCKKLGIEWAYFPIKDFSIPTNTDRFTLLVDKIILSFKKDKPVCVHCQAGIGRTGMVLACILGRYLGIDGKKALAAIRKARDKGAVETKEQEEFIRKFCAIE